MGAPEKIWVLWTDKGEMRPRVFDTDDDDIEQDLRDDVPYTRADLVDQMVAEAVAKERERCAGIADRFAKAMHDGAQQIKHRHPEIAYDRDDTASDLRVLADEMREGGEWCRPILSGSPSGA